MKKTIIIILLVLLFSACGTFKSAKETSSQIKQTEKREIKQDSLNLTTINKTIDDQVVVSLRTNNAVVDSIIRERLKGFSSQKTSGSNSYKATFDYEKMMLHIATLVGETKNTQTATHKEQTQENTFEKQTDAYISRKVKAIPWWFWLLVVFWFLPQITERISLVLNPLKGFFKQHLK